MVDSKVLKIRKVHEQGQVQVQKSIFFETQIEEMKSLKVKRLCVALIRLKEIQKNSVHLCVKTNPTSSDDNYSKLPTRIFYPNAYILR